MSPTRIGCHVNAPRASVYRALLEARAVATWMVPAGMTSHVHAFEPWEGARPDPSPTTAHQRRQDDAHTTPTMAAS